MLGFGSFETAEKTICGIETIHMIRKGQVEEIQSVLSEVEFINKIMGIAAWYFGGLQGNLVWWDFLHQSP